MARITALLGQARAAGLNVHRDGLALVVRGPEEQERLARELLSHKTLVLAVLDHEDACHEHERRQHGGQAVDWRLMDGVLLCGACRPGQGGDPAGGPSGEGDPVGAPACPMCRSAGRCEGRFPTVGGGWVCLAAVADGVLRNGRLRSGPPGR